MIFVHLGGSDEVESGENVDRSGRTACRASEECRSHRGFQRYLVAYPSAY